ncbi:MAG: protein kinase [Desulfobacula sp.]|nr:protein kinase [Desulfobacula sp.]
MKICPICGYQNKNDISICEECQFEFDSGMNSQMTELYTAEKFSLSQGSFISDRYEIIKELGRGGMGIVYLVKDIKLRNRLVALKITHPEIVSHKEARQRFKDEAILCLELLHPNIVRVHNLDEWNNCLYFTMEYIKGKNLREFIDERKDKNPPFTLEEALQVINPLLDALSYAHKTTIHRDIKPENILILGDYPDIHVKVFDFGIAKVLSASRFTRTAQSMGTAYYMSPEQMQGAKHIDHRSDLYSVGMILYEMLTGTIAAGRFKLPSEMVKNIPPMIDKIIDKVLSPAPENRLKNAKEMKRNLSSAVDVTLPSVVEPTESEKVTITRCLNCKFEIQTGWKICPGCGSKIDMRDQKRDTKSHQSDEVLYEDSVIDVLKARGDLEYSRTDLNHLRKRLGLSLRVSIEIEAACIKNFSSLDSKRNNLVPLLSDGGDSKNIKLEKEFQYKKLLTLFNKIQILKKNKLEKECQSNVKKKFCTSCCKEVQADWVMCPHCQTSLRNDTCWNCGKKMQADWVMCPYCLSKKGMKE